MRSLVWLAISSALAAGMAAASAAAQSAGDLNRFVIISTKARAAPPPPAKPYQPVAVKLPAEATDEGLEAFRSELAAAAKAKVYGALERLVTPTGFFWDRDFNGGFDRAAPGVDNLAAAIRLERQNGAGWAMLAALASEGTASPLVGRPGTICAPGEPSYDDVELDRLVYITRSSAPEWTYTRAEKTGVRAAPQSGAEIIDTLGLSFVRVLTQQANETKADAAGLNWSRVATPAGKVGYVAPGALASLTPQRLCYGRDGFGRWRIVGYIAGD